MRSKTFARLTIVSAFALAGSLVGCASYDGDDGGRHSDVQDDITPELMSQAQRHIDVDDDIYATWNANPRMMWADLHRLMLNDRPSLLTTMPTPY